MITVKKAKEVYKLIEELGYACCLAGSTMYRQDPENAKDIDIFVDFGSRPLEDFEGDLLDQLTLEDDYKLLSKTEPRTKRPWLDRNDVNNTYDHLGFIYQIAVLEDTEGDKINLIGTVLRPHSNLSYAMLVVNTFDYDVCQVAYAGRTVSTAAYKQAIKEKLIGIRYLYPKVAVNTRMAKIQKCFPGWGMRVQDMNTFSTAPNFLVRSFNKPPKTTFQQMVAVARARISNWRPPKN